MNTLGREIDYNDEWSSGNFRKASVYRPQLPDFDDYSQIPYPLLRNDLENHFKGLLNNKQNPPAPTQNNFLYLFNLLFGLNRPGNGPATQRPPATRTTTKKTTPMTTTPDPGAMTLSNRTRRPTKYKNKGHCKNPPKKHEKEDKHDKHDKDSDEEQDDAEDDSGERYLK